MKTKRKSEEWQIADDYRDLKEWHQKYINDAQAFTILGWMAAIGITAYIIAFWNYAINSAYHF